jgi:hypothetical protein
MDSANECFSGCARWHKAANMNGRAIPGAYLFRLYVFRLTKISANELIPERIVFVSRGINVFRFSATPNRRKLWWTNSGAVSEYDCTWFLKHNGNYVHHMLESVRAMETCILLIQLRNAYDFHN